MKKFIPQINGRLKAFSYAFDGFWYVLRTQKNAHIHSVASILVILMGIFLEISLIEWAVIALTIGFVWTAEFFNTALESIVDLASPDHHPLAKISKDVAAGAVLIASITSVVVGILILGPPLLSKLRLN